MNEYNDVKNWHKSTILEEVKGKLLKRGFNAAIYNTENEINDFLIKTIPANASVGLGGSITLRELGVDSTLKKRGNVLFDHWEKGLSPEQGLAARKKQLSSDYFLTSINALTLEGQIINIDGIGNRVASMIFGPSHVIAIAGYNKIAKDIDDALWRIKNFASPQNAKRLNMDTPCAKTGMCANCGAPKTICRVTTIIEYKPNLTDFTVILTPLELGF
jgi:hypothetical protein